MLRDSSTSNPLMVYGRRGKRKSYHMEAPIVGEQNNEMNDEETRNNCKRVPVPEELVYAGYGSTFSRRKFMRSSIWMMLTLNPFLWK